MDASHEDIKKLCSKFEMTNAQRKHILTLMPPCHAFFENLAIASPELSLRDLKSIIESFDPPNRSIFADIEKDIGSKLVSVTLDSQLGVLIDDSKSWSYILTALANNLLSEAATAEPSWKRVASRLGYRIEHIKAFMAKNRVDRSSAQKLISVLFADNPSLSHRDFMQKLEEIQRIDAANMVRHWAMETVVRQNLQNLSILSSLK